MVDSLSGKMIGKYEVVKLLGQGATADVYKAYQPTLNRHVAIKVLHPFLAADKDFLDRFRREAQAIAALRHPRIVQVYDFDVTGDKCYMVMEFIKGHTLETQLQEMAGRDKIMPLDEAIRIARDVASALSYAHDHGMVHRDVKPANVMINQENQVILTDFGIARILGGARHTATGAIVGTPYYMSPEQGLGKPGDTRSDLYSLGIMFFQMVTGQFPYDADTAVAVLLQHIQAPIPIPSRINPALPLDVDRIILKVIAKNPDDRYQTATELVEHLDQARTGAPTQKVALPTPSVSPSPPLPPSPSPAPVLTGAGWLKSYTLSRGHVATSPADLPAVCDADWNRAATHFAKGYITKWLRDGVNALRAAHQHGLADNLEQITGRAEAIVQRIQGSDEIARNVGLEEFLELLGATPPIMDVTPKRLDLPAAGVGEVGRPVTLTITNKGRGYLSGSVVNRVPWLKATVRRFGFAAGERFLVTVKPDLRDLPAGETQSAQALWIRSVGGDLLLEAQVNILPAVLHVDAVQADNTLDFGTVEQGEAAQTMLTLRNDGHGYLAGKLYCRVPWLTASPKQFRVPAGNSLQVTVKVDSQALPPGDVSQAGALVIESIGGQVTLDVQMHVLPPCLVVEPDRVDLGTLDLVQPEVGRSVELTVRNTGYGVLTGEVATVADWLKVEPAAFRCKAGEAQQLRLSTVGLRTGDYRQTVRVSSNAGVAEVPVLLRVCFSLEPEMVHIPAGEFLRGSKEGDKAALPAEKPQRRIYLSEYWIGKYPVTNAQYTVFVEATGRRLPEHWQGGRPPKGEENHPVRNTSWWDAVAYCHWLAEVTGKPYRVPTEAQWEKAARGAAGRSYPWGNRWSKRKCNARGGGKRGTTPVGAYSPAGDSPYGCADMAGNVWEWVSDWYKKDYYTRSTVFENPHGPSSGALKVLRGGSWLDSASRVRCANRAYGNRKLPSPEIGFRCALAPKTSEADSPE